MCSLARGLGAAASAVLAAPAALVLFASAAPAAPAALAAADGGRSPGSFTIEDTRITESSGLAASHAHPGVFWTHNDSDDGPYVYGVDSATGRTVATVTLGGISPRDVEAISVGPDGQVYIGDIGDNLGGSWSEVWIYRFPEPEELRDTTVTPVRHTVRYADGPRDAESLMVHPKTGRVYIVSKKEEGGGLYAGPEKLSASGVNTFRRVAGIDLWATDGAFSPDGTRLVVRSYFEARAYRWTVGAQGGPLEPIGRPSLPMQRQGESVAFTPDGRALMYGTEGARSRVTRMELDGQLLPDSAADAEDRDKAGKAGQGSQGNKGDDPGDAIGADGEKDRNLAVGALTFAAAAALVMGLRKLTRRRD
jgi:sugar lactone lactonase YvrE